MPLIEQSSYKAPPFPLCCSHVQTILPSYLRHVSIPKHWEREVFHTPDDDELLLDWSRVGSDRLLVISHGLCGSSTRHYVLSLVHAFNQAGWDCLAWNFRGTGGSPGKKLKFTTHNSTEELDWVTRHALAVGYYRKVAFSGFSMGGNLSALYLTREADRLPPEVCGGAVFCAVTDIRASNLTFLHGMGRLYVKSFLKDLVAMLKRKSADFPGELEVDGFEKFTTFEEFDDHFTAPYLGLSGREDFYRLASSCHYFPRLTVPLLMVAPKNDPFLAGECYPVEEARRNPNLFLEMPVSGGHCGFITLHGEWWPARRAVEFLQNCVETKLKSNEQRGNISK